MICFIYFEQSWRLNLSLCGRVMQGNHVYFSDCLHKILLEWMELHSHRLLNVSGESNNETGFYVITFKNLAVFSSGISCLKSVLFSPPDAVPWIQETTPCSPGLVITLDLPRPYRDTLSPCPTLTPTPRLVHLTLATHPASHTHGQVTLGASTPATTPTRGDYIQEICVPHDWLSDVKHVMSCQKLLFNVLTLLCLCRLYTWVRFLYSIKSPFNLLFHFLSSPSVVMRLILTHCLTAPGFLFLVPSREDLCVRMCPPLLPLHFVDYGMTLWCVELGVEATGRGILWMKVNSEI